MNKIEKDRFKCSLCGLEFNEDEALTACKDCVIRRDNCKLIKCPKCGYESLPEPRWLRSLFGGRNKNEVK